MNRIRFLSCRKGADVYHKAVTPYFNLVKILPCPFNRRISWLVQLSRNSGRYIGPKAQAVLTVPQFPGRILNV